MDFDKEYLLIASLLNVYIYMGMCSKGSVFSTGKADFLNSLYKFKGGKGWTL